MKFNVSYLSTNIKSSFSKNIKVILGAVVSLFAVTPLAAQNTTTLAEMSATEIITLLDGCKVGNLMIPQSGKETTVSVSAKDMITKVYGVLDNELSRQEMMADSFKKISMVPTSDETGLWLESIGGYNIDFSGMTPEVAAMARFNGNELTDYGYFFLFPYSMNHKEQANESQCRFCGTLLQELSGMNGDWGVNSMNKDLFEVIGEYEGNFVDLRLIDDPGNGNNEGRYILLMSVEPKGFTSGDEIAAL